MIADSASQTCLTTGEKRMTSRSLLLLPILILSLSFAACSSGGSDIALDKGAIVPDFTLPDIEGNTVNFKKDMGEGNTYLLFWSSSCVSCKEGMAVLEEVYKKNKDQGFSVVAINVYQDKETVTGFIKEIGITYPVLLDTKGTVATAYEVFAIPVVYVIDTRGAVRDKFLGEMTRENVEAFIEEYWS